MKILVILIFSFFSGVALLVILYYSQKIRKLNPPTRREKALQERLDEVEEVLYEIENLDKSGIPILPQNIAEQIEDLRNRRVKGLT